MSGQQLRWFRRRRGMSQTTFGKQLGVSRHVIAKFEELESLPKHLELACAALALGVEEYSGEGVIAAAGKLLMPPPPVREPERRGRPPKQRALGYLRATP